jgi:excisionase family DNA binding protein
VRHHATQTIADPAFFDREEAAGKLRISVTTVDRLIKAGKLRAARIGRRVVISPQALDAFRRDAEAAEWGESA